MAKYSINKKVQETFISSVKNAVISKSIYIFMLSDLEAAGFKYAAFQFGRDIDMKHAKDLYKALIRDGKSQFTKRVEAMSANAVLEVNETLPEGATPLRIYDLNGKELTLETPDIEKYLVYLDGNHRWFVHNQHPEIDMEVEIAVVEDPFGFMADYNSLSCNWSLKHWLHANQVTGRTEIGIHDDVAEVEKQLGVSMKYASYLLSREREAVKKSDLEMGKDTTVNNPEFVQRGKVLANTIATIFPKPGKDSTNQEKVLYKGVRTLQFLDAIEYSDKVNPALSLDFAKQFCAYLCCLSENDKDVLSRFIEDKDYAGIKKNVSKTYGVFLKVHEHDMETQILIAEELTAQLLSAESKEDSKPIALKSGTATQLIRSMEVEKAYKQAEIADEALSKANASLSKAQAKFEKAEDKFNTSSDKSKDRNYQKVQEAQKALSMAEEAVERAKADKESADAKYADLNAA